MKQGNFYLGLKPQERQENSDPSLPSLPECFFLHIAAPPTTAPLTRRRPRLVMMPMMGMEGSGDFVEENEGALTSGLSPDFV